MVLFGSEPNDREVAVAKGLDPLVLTRTQELLHRKELPLDEETGARAKGAHQRATIRRGNDDRRILGHRTAFPVLDFAFEELPRRGQLVGRLEALGKGHAQLASEFDWTEQLAAQSK